MTLEAVRATQKKPLPLNYLPCNSSQNHTACMRYNSPKLLHPLLLPVIGLSSYAMCMDALQWPQDLKVCRKQATQASRHSSKSTSSLTKCSFCGVSATDWQGLHDHDPRLGCDPHFSHQAPTYCWFTVSTVKKNNWRNWGTEGRLKLGGFVQTPMFRNLGQECNRVLNNLRPKSPTDVSLVEG